MKSLICTICTVIAISNVAFAQSTIKGKTNEFANVQILELKKGTQANQSGEFAMNLAKSGNFTLQISAIGFKTYSEKFSIQKGETKILNIELKTLSNDLNEVEVTAKSEGQKLREQGIKADIIDIKKVQYLSSSLSEVLNRSVGIKIRQSGGLGASSQININGFSDKAVKIFKDGIPVDYMGAGFNVSLLPLNILDRVEIYKGIMPIYLGADALGGGINFVTKSNARKSLDLSYEYSSFNTHRFTVNSYWSDKNDKFYAGFDGFFNHSDNNYKVIAKVLDFQTSTRADKEVTRFHDGFTNPYAEVFVGLKNTKLADELRFAFAGFYIKRENQHGALMGNPYGEAISYQKAFIPSVRYKKRFLDGKLGIDQFLVYSKINAQQVDTCRCRYDWLGNKVKSQTVGETDDSGVLSDINFDHQVSRTLLSYQLNANNKLEINNTIAQFSRLGSDPFGPVYFYNNQDILTAKAAYFKWVLGIGLNSKWLNGRFENQVALKRYNFRTNGTDGAYNSYEQGQKVNSNSQWGVAEAFKININEKSFLRFGVEFAYRLPEQSEVFGDGMFLLSNFDLKPENSKNFNLGYRHQAPKFTIEPNVFYRITKDQINLVPAFIPFSQYQNVEQVKGYGTEIDLSWRPSPKWDLFANATYQSIRQFDLQTLSAQFLEGARLRNVPYLFGNFGLRNNYKNLLNTNDAITWGYFFNYTHNYYLGNIPKSIEPKNIFEKAQIDTELIIPNQALHSVFLTYTFPNQRIILNTELKNLTNIAAFDNFRVQKPGRSIHFKISYNLNN